MEFRAILGGLIGGLVGAAVWAALAYFTGFEIGWIAWGVGIAVGYGVQKGTEGAFGTGSAVGAVVITILAIGAGKMASVLLFVEDEYDLVTQDVEQQFASEEYVISYVADEVIGERLDAGEEVAWPANVDPSEAAQESDYPADVWAVALERWEAMTPSEQGAFGDAKREEMMHSITSRKSEVVSEAFLASFGLFDLLFFALAIGSAYKLGGGNALGQVARE